jgi:hypothetical protein
MSWVRWIPLVFGVTWIALPVNDTFRTLVWGVLGGALLSAFIGLGILIGVAWIGAPYFFGSRIPEVSPVQVAGPLTLALMVFAVIWAMATDGNDFVFWLGFLVGACALVVPLVLFGTPAPGGREWLNRVFGLTDFDFDRLIPQRSSGIEVQAPLRYYDVSVGSVWHACFKAIEGRGWSLTGENFGLDEIYFATGRSMRSWRGQAMSVLVFETKDGRTCVSLIGMRVEGGRRANDWGEKAKLTRQFFESLDGALAQQEPTLTTLRDDR